MNSGRLLVHCSVDELLRSAKRIRAVLDDGRLPAATPDEVIWQRVSRREWQLTVYPFSDHTLDKIRADNPVAEEVEVLDLGLDDIFKDFIRGQTQSC